VKAVFVELPAFTRYRASYLDDEGFRGLQEAMMKNPEAGDVIEGTGACASCGMATRAGARASGAACG
jgi:hypothetical protein